jgi:hypothetical protein
MSEKSKADVSQEEFEKGRGQAIAFAWLVYGGVVVAATTLFISFVLGAFPENAYFSRGVMSVAGFMIGLSMIAFPFALHKWAVEKEHRAWTIRLYYGEMFFVAVNTFVSFVTLLSQNAGYAAPEWAILYEPFSILAIVYTLAAWGTVFLKDPRHKSVVKGLEAMQSFEDKIADKLVEFVDSADGLAAIQRSAEHRIAQVFDSEKYNKAPKPFIPNAPVRQLNSDTERVELGQGSGNGQHKADPTNQSRR